MEGKLQPEAEPDEGLEPTERERQTRAAPPPSEPPPSDPFEDEWHDDDYRFEYDVYKEIFHKQSRLFRTLKGPEANTLTAHLISLVGIAAVLMRFGMVGTTEWSLGVSVISGGIWAWACYHIACVVWPRGWLNIPEPSHLRLTFAYCRLLGEREGVDWHDIYRVRLTDNYEELADWFLRTNKDLERSVDRAKFLLLASSTSLIVAAVLNYA